MCEVDLHLGSTRDPLRAARSPLQTLGISWHRIHVASARPRSCNTHRPASLDSMILYYFSICVAFSTSQHVWLVLVEFDRGMGAFQLPDSVDGAAIACLLYSALCLIANVILVWLVWVHRERTSCEFIMGRYCAVVLFSCACADHKFASSQMLLLYLILPSWLQSRVLFNSFTTISCGSIL